MFIQGEKIIFTVKRRLNSLYKKGYLTRRLFILQKVYVCYVLQEYRMAVTTLNLPAFPIFDVTEVTTRWKKYKRKFEILCTALAVTDEKQKLAMLLNYVGDDTFEIYENILNPEVEHTYKDVIEALDTHFEPKVNHSYETYLFRLMTDETKR